MIKAHITPGLNGYTTTAGKQIKAINAKQQKKKEKIERRNALRELISRSTPKQHSLRDMR